MATGSFKLDLEPQKRNVFVTQLHQREDEDDIHAFPVVQDSANKLIETGINTLQRTLLLKKEVEVEQVQHELEDKRHEFRQRMDQCSSRQIDVQKKQQKMKDRVTKFEKFIQENEAKRRRAIQKYQGEVKLKEQKTRELEMLIEQLEEIKDRHEYLQRKLSMYKKYEEYLLQVIEAMPEDYIPATDDKLKGLMMRHRTLSDSNKGLVENLENMSDELETLRGELEEMKQEHDKRKISNNSELARLQKDQDMHSQVNDLGEEKFLMGKGELRFRRTELGVILMAIDNIAEKCRKELDPTLDKLSLEQKLQKIKEYLNERREVMRMARPENESESLYSSRKLSAAKSRKTRTPTRTPAPKVTIQVKEG